MSQAPLAAQTPLLWGLDDVPPPPRVATWTTTTAFLGGGAAFSGEHQALRGGQAGLEHVQASRCRWAVFLSQIAGPLLDLHVFCAGNAEDVS